MDQSPKPGGIVAPPERSANASDFELELRGWATDLLGPTRDWIRLDSRQGSTAVFGLRGADGRALIVKRFRSARGFAQEHDALTRWFATPFAQVPSLLAAEPRLAALMLERLPGAAPEPGALDPDETAAVHEAAGRFLAKLHRLGLPDDDPVPLAEALTRRIRSWSRRAKLAPEFVDLVAEHGPRPELFEGAARVPCHRDFAPRNWLWDGSDLAVIDFEHARMDLALVDLAKLYVGSWRGQPTRAAAFFRGYGRVLSALEQVQLRSIVVLHGVASVAWGQEHGQADYLDEGRAALAMAAAWSSAP